MKTAIVKKDDLSIASKYDGEANQSAYGGPWGDSDSHIHIQSDSLDMDCIEAWDDNGEIKLREVQDLLDAKVQSARDAKLVLMRACRGDKIAEADHQINMHDDGDADAIGTEADWRTYRKALRDITANYRTGSDPSHADWNKATATIDAVADDLSDMVWPVKPS